VTHVAGYLLAGLAHLIVRTDVAAHHSTGNGDWKKSVLVQYFSSSRS
jgi:hypothetical protein